MRTVPNMESHFDGRFYHVTSFQKAKALLEQGFGEQLSYWSVGSPISNYYAECVNDDGMQAVSLSVSLGDLDEELIMPDIPSIIEPLTWTLKTTEDLVIGAWNEMPGTWRDSLNLVGSIAYNGAIPARLLTMEGVIHAPSRPLQRTTA